MQQAPYALHDLSTLVKLNGDLITGHYFDFFPPTDAQGHYTGNANDLPYLITVEAVLDPDTLPSGYDPAVNWLDRFSCPRAVANAPLLKPDASPTYYYLTCATSGVGAPDNGNCWCALFDGMDSEDRNQNGVLDTGKCSGTGATCINYFSCGGTVGSCLGAEDIGGAYDSQGHWIPNGKLDGGCMRADYVAGTYTGTACEMNIYPTQAISLPDPEGYLFKQQIWARLGSEAAADPVWDAPLPSCGDLRLARASSPGSGSDEYGKPDDGMTPQASDASDGSEGVGREGGAGEWSARIAGIAVAMEDGSLPEGAEPEASPHRTVGSTAIPYNEVTYYHTDHLGSVRLTTDRRGYRVRETTYWPFGDEAMPAAWDTNTHRFTGHERDLDTGMDYMLARYYSAGLSRFLSVDPGDDTDVENPQSWNKFAYVRNNPLRLVDNDGKQSVLMIDPLGAAGHLLAGFVEQVTAPAQGLSQEIRDAAQAASDSLKLTGTAQVGPYTASADTQGGTSAGGELKLTKGDNEVGSVGIEAPSEGGTPTGSVTIPLGEGFVASADTAGNVGVGVGASVPKVPAGGSVVASTNASSVAKAFKEGYKKGKEAAEGRAKEHYKQAAVKSGLSP